MGTVYRSIVIGINRIRAPPAPVVGAPWSKGPKHGRVKHSAEIAFGARGAAPEWDVRLGTNLSIRG